MKIAFARPLRNIRLTSRPMDSMGPIADHDAAECESTPNIRPVPAAPETTVVAASPEPSIEESKLAAVQELLELQRSIAEQLGDLESRRRQSLDELQRLALEIAMAVATRVVHRAIDNGEMQFTKLVEMAVERFDRTLPVTVFLHPVDLQQWQDTLEHETIPPLAPTQVRLVPDRNVTRGGCRVDNGSFSLLFDWESQINELREYLERTLHDAEIERRQDTPEDRKLGRFPDRRETA